jgi:hypothetical protein
MLIIFSYRYNLCNNQCAVVEKINILSFFLSFFQLGINLFR